MFVLMCVVQSGQKEKDRKIRTKKYELKYRGKTNKNIPMKARFSAPVWTGPRAHPASYT
jgi:hypothetical protein